MKVLALKLEQKLLTLPQPESADSTVDRLERMPWLPLTISAEVPVAKFTLRDLFYLVEGSIVETACNQLSNVPMRANNVLVGWGEFEVMGNHRAVRFSDPA
jgi:flagellar motor switch/type III secretory pathway protein FliN